MSKTLDILHGFSYVRNVAFDYFDRYSERRSRDAVGSYDFGIVLWVLPIDYFMLVAQLSAPGDERGQIIVWKASAFTLLGMVGALILEVIENFVRSQEMAINPFVQLEVIAILSILYPLYRAVRGWTWRIRSGQDGRNWGCPRKSWRKNAVSSSRQTVNAIENNQYDPTLSLAFSLARELQVTVDELLRAGVSVGIVKLER